VPGPLVDEIDVEPLDFGDELINRLTLTTTSRIRCHHLATTFWDGHSGFPVHPERVGGRSCRWLMADS